MKENQEDKRRWKSMPSDPEELAKAPVPVDRVLPPSSVATPCLNASVSWPACVGERH